ncbi:MAG: CoA-binding protein [Thermoplasmata archaeon]
MPEEHTVSSEEIKNILTRSRTIAVVGMSARPEKPSHMVATYLRNAGYEIIPVNPNHSEISGLKSYPDLESIPNEVDAVDIFRKSDYVEPIVESAIRKGARVVWMQEGIVNHKAAERARRAGLRVVMDKCMMREHARLMV